MLHNLAYQRTGRLNKCGIDKLVWLVRLIDRSWAQYQGWAELLNKRRFSAVIHHFRLNPQQRFYHFNQFMISGALPPKMTVVMLNPTL